VAEVEVRARVEAGNRADVAWVPVGNACAQTADTRRLIREAYPAISKNAPSAAPP
jgi:hypothetical protein